MMGSIVINVCKLCKVKLLHDTFNAFVSRLWTILTVELLLFYRLYLNGVNLDPLAIYPPVQLPVSPSTPMLSSLVRWDHSDSWAVPTVTSYLAGSSSANSVEVDISSADSEDAYLTGHIIDGRVIYPATGYLVLAWQQLARMNGQTYQQTPVSFDDVHLHRATLFPSSGMLDSYCEFDVAVCRLASQWIT